MGSFYLVSEHQAGHGLKPEAPNLPASKGRKREGHGPVGAGSPHPLVLVLTCLGASLS